jgi:hypothetical protein
VKCLNFQIERLIVEALSDTLKFFTDTNDI